MKPAAVGGDLYRVSTSHDAGVEPSVQRNGGRVLVFLAGPGGGRRSVGGVSALTVGRL